MVSVDLKTIWVLSILLLVIILLSAVKVCPHTRVIHIDPYYDVKYKENFNNPVDAALGQLNDYDSMKQLIKEHHSKVISETIDQNRQDKDISTLEQGIQKVEKLLNDISRYDQ